MSQEIASAYEGFFQREVLSPENVIQMYARVDKYPRQDVIDMIQLYPWWSKQQYSLEGLGKLDWYFERDPNHVSWILTNGGRSRSVLNVAKQYQSFHTSLPQEWGRVKDIEEMVVCIENGRLFPPLLVVEGSRYPESPDSSFIDGVHRALAFEVYSLRNSEKEILVDVVVGRKADLLTRLSKKLGLP